MVPFPTNAPSLPPDAPPADRNGSAPRVRPARLEDAAALQAIYAPYVLTSTATFEVEPPDVAAMTQRLAPLLAEGYPALVAEDPAGRVIGYAWAGPYHRRPAYRPTVENAIYIAGDQRRGGVGRVLMTALIDAATTAGFRQMIAVISDSANEASLGFHAALGFTPVARLPSVGWKFGRWLDVFFLQRPLGSGAEAPPPTSGPAAPDGPPTFR